MSAVIDLRARDAPTSTVAVASYIIAYLTFWTAAPLLLGQEIPSDNIEQLNWALQPALGYLKHPPLPTWILWLSEQVAPGSVPLTYALGGLEGLFTLFMAYLLGRATLGEKRGRLGALLLTCITYYTLRLHYYNHNTALLCATAAASLCTWRAFHEDRVRWWVALGLCWAAGALSKYQMALTVACNLAFLACPSPIPLSRRLRGVLIAGGVATLLCAPHFLWLIAHHFPSFDYAASQLDSALDATGRLDSLVRFFTNQTLRLLPALALLWVLAWLTHRQLRTPDSPEPDPGELPAGAAARFWSVHALGPFVLMACMTLVGGVDLEMHWGTAFLWTVPFWILSRRSSPAFESLAPHDALAALAVMQGLLMTGKVLFPDA